MNSLLNKQQFTISQNKRNQFCRSLLETWKGLSLPTEKEESYRKFPISALNWKELGFDPQEKKTKFDDSSPSLEKDSVSDDILEGIFGLLQNYLPKDYFSYLAVLQSHEFEFHYCEDGLITPVYTSLGDEPKFLFRIFYVPKGKISQIHLKTQTLHNSESLHLQTGIDVFISDKDSQVEILDEETFDEDLVQFRTVLLLSKENTSVKYHHFPFGGFRSKLVLHSHLLGKGAEVTVDGVSALGKRNLKDLDMEMHHHADHTTSKITYKAIVTDRSHHVFTGNLIIPPNLKKVVAHQESFNLSLNKKARAEANPKLEVLAEDVSCTHGATVGDIDEEQYFYLLSRGLSPEESKSLLVTAFYGETIQSVGFKEEVKLDLESSIHNILVGGK
ncbi:SufD family Fe-S cluster assembly protein [Leptospira levettii]|uniref:SufD family Fe-S cluster assembly protein n=1 Tax=Leptospira levettii TaxID=2023178 RepID=UPI00108264C7|nr:SufD family Fe-S cluster assembly protein [Leptospira levettii]TGL15906.1 SufD family Fe-S cluster assembly protein [Leptospira levettii]TGM94048.1 SufD family Fe-S cluster assembly protein [Leptospira levettii]